MNFYYVYLLKSLRKNYFYTGYTKNLRKRFKEHNQQEELSTKGYAPFELIFYEAYKTMSDAKRREQYLKTTKGKAILKLILKDYFISIGK